MPTPVSHPDWTAGWWDWLINLPWWQGIIVVSLLTTVALWAIRGVIQGLWANPLTHDWLSPNLDVFLACGIGAMLWLAGTMQPGDGITHGWPYFVLNYGSIAFWFAFAMWKWWGERKEVTSWSRRLGAASLWHVGVLVYIGPLYTILLVNTCVFTPWHTLLRIAVRTVPIIVALAWLLAGMIYDPEHRTTPAGDSKFAYTSPEDGWRRVRLIIKAITK